MEIQLSAGASCLSLMSPSPSAVRLCHILGPRKRLVKYGQLPSRKCIISHLGKTKIIFKHDLSGGYVNSLEGTYDWIHTVGC